MRDFYYCWCDYKDNHQLACSNAVAVGGKWSTSKNLKTFEMYVN